MVVNMFMTAYFSECMNSTDTTMFSLRGCCQREECVCECVC